MNGRKYIIEQKLKKDTEKFEKKLYLSDNINFYTSQIKIFSSQIDDLVKKKNIATTHQENTEDMLKRYIAELNIKIFPDKYNKNYGDENIKINLSNIRTLSNLQKIKKEMLIEDRKMLEDNIKDIIYYFDLIKRKKIKKQIKSDIYIFQLFEEKRQTIEDIKSQIPELLRRFEMAIQYTRENEVLYEQIIEENKMLEIKLNKQKNINKQLIEMMKEKEKNGDDNKKLKRKRNLNNDIEEGYIEKKFFGNIRNLSEYNFLVNPQKDKKSNETKIHKAISRIHSTLFDNPKFEGYKSPMRFMISNKPKIKKLMKKYKPLNAYNFLNIFSNNKRFESVGDFIQNFNSVNKKKISFYPLNSDNSSTKAKTISTNFSSPKNKNKIRLLSSQQLTKDDSSKILLFRDYLCDLINHQKNIIKDLTNKNSEEIRSNNQVKQFIEDCINDINIEIKNINENEKDNKVKEKLIKPNEKILYILSYIFDNCFSGLKNNIKKLIDKSRNERSNKIKNYYSE